MMGIVKDLSGTRYGKLLVVKLNSRKVDENGKLMEPIYHCECDCGNTCDVPARILRTGRRKTCGCKVSRPSLNKVDLPVFKEGDFPRCEFPSYSCPFSRQGRCCRACSKYDVCDDRCLNTPERCVL